MPSSQQINFVDMAQLSLIAIQSKTRHSMDFGSRFLVYAQKSSYTSGYGHMSFQDLDNAVITGPMS